MYFHLFLISTVDTALVGGRPLLKGGAYIRLSVALIGAALV